MSVSDKAHQRLINEVRALESQLATATAELVKIKGRCAEYAEDLRISLAAKQVAEREREEAREVLACTTDIANSWARELGGVGEAENESGLRDLVDRLWGVTSSRYFGMKGNCEDALSEGKQALEHAETERGSLRAQLAEARNRALEEAAERFKAFMFAQFYYRSDHTYSGNQIGNWVYGAIDAIRALKEAHA